MRIATTGIKCPITLTPGNGLNGMKGSIFSVILIQPHLTFSVFLSSSIILVLL